MTDDDETLKAIEELDQILDQEREALITGDLDQLTRLLELKESLIDQINAKDSVQKEQLADVQDKVARNQALLHSAMEGIRAVADRMADLRRVRQGLETYDRTGRKTQFPTQVQRIVEKRA